MLTRCLRSIGAALVAGSIAFGAAGAPAKADSTSTILITAAAAVALFTGINMWEKNIKAHRVVGYLPNGSVVYADGHVVTPYGRSWYPGNAGLNIACSGTLCFIVGPGAPGLNPYGYPPYGALGFGYPLMGNPQFGYPISGGFPYYGQYVALTGLGAPACLPYYPVWTYAYAGCNPWTRPIVYPVRYRRPVNRPIALRGVRVGGAPLHLGRPPVFGPVRAPQAPIVMHPFHAPAIARAPRPVLAPPVAVRAVRAHPVAVHPIAVHPIVAHPIAVHPIVAHPIAVRAPGAPVVVPDPIVQTPVIAAPVSLKAPSAPVLEKPQAPVQPAPAPRAPVAHAPQAAPHRVPPPERAAAGGRRPPA